MLTSNSNEVGHLQIEEGGENRFAQFTLCVIVMFSFRIVPLCNLSYGVSASFDIAMKLLAEKKRSCPLSANVKNVSTNFNVFLNNFDTIRRLKKRINVYDYYRKSKQRWRVNIPSQMTATVKVKSNHSAIVRQNSRKNL